MAKRSIPTEAAMRAKENILKGFDRARLRMADIPLGHEQVDPRTHRKRQEEKQMDPGMDATLHRMLWEHRNQNAEQMPTGGYEYGGGGAYEAGD